jgi:hypothetical protein
LKEKAEPGIRDERIPLAFFLGVILALFETGLF